MLGLYSLRSRNLKFVNSDPSVEKINTVCDMSAVSFVFIPKFARQKLLSEHDAREVVEPTQVLKEPLFFVWQFTMTGMVCLYLTLPGSRFQLYCILLGVMAKKHDCIKLYVCVCENVCCIGADGAFVYQC